MPTLLGFLVVTQFLTANADATLSQTQVTWSMEIILPITAQPGLQLPLVQPLAAHFEPGADLGGLRPVRNALGMLTAFDVVRALPEHHVDAQCVRVATIAFTVPRREDALDAPLLRGHALQRITLQNGWRFKPSSADVLQHVGFFSDAQTSHAQRSEVDNVLTRTHPPPSSQRGYLRGDGATSLAGRWDNPDQHRARGAWLAAGVFPVALVGLVYGSHRLKRAVAFERAEADLAEAYKELER